MLYEAFLITFYIDSKMTKNEIITEALIRPLMMQEVRYILDSETRGEDVCPYCGSENFMSGELKTFDKKYWLGDEDRDTYIFVCCDCDYGRFNEPEEREELKFWYIRDFWADKLKEHGERIFGLDEGQVWECQHDGPYYEDPIWKTILKELPQ